METLHRVVVFIWILYANKENANGAELFEGLVKDRAFVSISNAPFYQCTTYGINVDLSKFAISGNKNGNEDGNEIVMFYEKQLGLYPYLRFDGTPVNWGLPQIAARHLDTHLEKVKLDVSHFIPDVNFTGLAVIDWEAWRPILIRNGYNSMQRKYIAASRKLVRDRHPSWPEDWIDLIAAADFESGARLFMQKTLELCKLLRPKGFWGFYGFPDCYNYSPGQRTCTDQNIQMNNRLWWLINTSTVILPSIYIQHKQGTHQQRFWNIRGHLQEAIRLRDRNNDPYKPILAYTRFVYRDTGRYYDIEDLRSTIGQTADLGLDGVVLWEASTTFQGKAMCEATSRYVNQTLGPLVLNETLSLNNCSKNLCNRNGRCVKTEVTPPGNQTKVSLSPVLNGHLIQLWLKNILIRFMNWNTVTQMKAHLGHVDTYVCQCYEGWKGKHCDTRETSRAGGTLTFQTFKETNTHE